MFRSIVSSTRKIIQLATITTFIGLTLFNAPINADYLTAKGSKLYNDKGQEVRLTGVNWFGLETTNMFPHGLWARDYHGVLRQVKEMGFNCMRIPFCNEMLRDNAKGDKPGFYGEDTYYPRDKTELNKELTGLKPVEILDKIIDCANDLGLVIILDNHSRDHDGYMNEKVWYTESTTEQLWIDDWVMLAKRYKGNRAVIGFDLENEPHGKISEQGSTWGAGNPATDWNVAAQKCGNAILAANPDLLIIIEGVQQYESTNYWWGGNLRGVKKAPIVLTKPEKLVYSPHEYGPEVFQQDWFFESSFPDNMEAVWDNAFGFIAKENIAPLLVGEFGISSLSSYEGKAGMWLRTFVKYMAKLGISFTFWALNPNSGDTGGMLKYDWVSPEQWKLDEVKTLFSPLINEPAPVIKHLKTRASYSRIQFNSNKKTLQYAGTIDKNFSMSVVTINGQEVLTSNNTLLHMNNIAPGLYSVFVRNGHRTIESLSFTVK